MVCGCARTRGRDLLVKAPATPATKAPLAVQKPVAAKPTKAPVVQKPVAAQPAAKPITKAPIAVARSRYAHYDFSSHEYAHLYWKIVKAQPGKPPTTVEKPVSVKPFESKIVKAPVKPIAKVPTATEKPVAVKPVVKAPANSTVGRNHVPLMCRTNTGVQVTEVKPIVKAPVNASIGELKVKRRRTLFSLFCSRDDCSP
ncbi:hypothetical protein B0H19DRAFT_1255234 [Mycena capillaripes]|nr:hypothetical protein B0H19DRAFT_1255234 [Mycena capillaripes]